MKAVTKPFTYEELDPVAAQYLLTKETLIKEQAALTIQVIGQHLIEAKQAYPRYFMRWVASQFPNLSYATINIWMKVARNLPTLEAEVLANLDVRALAALASPSTPEDVQARIIEMARNQRVSLEVVQVAKSGIVPIDQRVESGDLAPKDAIGIIQALKHAPQPVTDLVLGTDVSKPEVVHYLCRTYAVAQKQPTGEHGWDDVLHNGGFMIDDLYVPLKEATAETVAHYTQYRAQMHAIEAATWVTVVKQVRPRSVGMQGDCLHLTIPIPAQFRDRVNFSPLFVSIDMKETLKDA